ncbi:MAG: hypothetical protein UW30_C0021G0004 [Candidatus Giovannonibacteria bacterium GW2011_GWA2_44_13b]|uniref:DUF559 domain-containing protein n=2 Tax=Candidatus Giovannoniibacteriota TaxID=1752738 RepID=A0A0G1JYK2_9BACT|nr:MAG: hypothetical protein UW30_C0021G0004 [Candidatus Giovannonibacteria bacterium GW2011_GWA2_44_13b]OGF83120.1 MAG: hypothetical protein A2924_04045 [Candidatus Giovannonibacteria bacterium RIFCSPLOWO2_01_FULL_44_16]
MKHIYNNKILIERRRGLRSNLTEAEKILWRYLGNSKLAGFRFFRQYSAGGGSHIPDEQKLYDAERTKYLNGNNIKVLRFWNNDLINDIDSVIAKIIESTK